MDNKILIFNGILSVIKPRNSNNVKFRALFEILQFSLWSESPIRFFIVNKTSRNPLKADTYIYALLTGILSFSTKSLNRSTRPYCTVFETTYTSGCKFGWICYANVSFFFVCDGEARLLIFYKT